MTGPPDSRGPARPARPGDRGRAADRDLAPRHAGRERRGAGGARAHGRGGAGRARGRAARRSGARPQPVRRALHAGRPRSTRRASCSCSPRATPLPRSTSPSSRGRPWCPSPSIAACCSMSWRGCLWGDDEAASCGRSTTGAATRPRCALAEAPDAPPPPRVRPGPGEDAAREARRAAIGLHLHGVARDPVEEIRVPCARQGCAHRSPITSRWPMSRRGAASAISTP